MGCLDWVVESAKRRIDCEMSSQLGLVLYGYIELVYVKRARESEPTHNFSHQPLPQYELA